METTSTVSSEGDGGKPDYYDLKKSLTRRDGCSPFGAIFDAAASADVTELHNYLQAVQQLTESDRRKYVIDAYHDGSHSNSSWDTPLLRAIACQRYDNVALLLQYGMDPNGVSTEIQEEWSLRYRRVRGANGCQRSLSNQVSSKKVGPPQTQTLPIMQHELEARKLEVSRFWIDEGTPPTDLAANGDRLGSLVMAASTTPAIFDLLVAAGADSSFWTTTETPTELPENPLKPSMLCVATPLQEAIKSNNIQMLHAILERDFNANARALIAGCQAFSPLQYAIFIGNLDAYQILIQNPRTDATLLTPGYQVHLLHFAVAHLRIDIMETIQIPLADARPTALKHNLAHIACLPFEDIPHSFSPKVKQSIHDVRSLDPWMRPNPAFYHSVSVRRHRLRAPEPDCDGPGDLRSRSSGNDNPFFGLPLEQRRSPASSSGSTRWFLPPSIEHFGTQMKVVKRIIDALGIEAIRSRDYCLNTPLHYLACTRIVNDDLVAYIRGLQGGNEIWTRIENWWGHTPKDLWLCNMTIMEPSQCPPGNRCRGRGSCTVANYGR